MSHEQHEAALASLEQKTSVFRDIVTAVAKGYKTGLFVHGPGGTGKSFTVLDQLRRLGVPCELSNSRMTGKGLFLALQGKRDAVHVLEDMERLTRDPDAQGVLRSALWAQPGYARKVTWTTARDPVEPFEFRGGLILISNAPLANLPELKALATRIEVHKVEVSDAELAAKMRELAGAGWTADDGAALPPETCREVTEWLLQECRAAACPIDLRLQRKAFQTYRQHAAGHSQNHWRDLLAASVREATCHFRFVADTAAPEDRKARRRDALLAIMREHPPAAWEEAYTAETGASRADYFRLKKEVKSESPVAG